MKKIINFAILFVCTALVISSAQAKSAKIGLPHKIVVRLEQDFSTDNPTKYVKVAINDYYNLPNSKQIEKNSELLMEVVKITPEKIGKRNASFEARIIELYIPSQEKRITVTNPEAIVKISEYKKLDVADKIGDAGITVANHFVNNIAAPANFVRGFVENESGNRIESGAKKVYDKSVLSYTSKGKPLVFKAGDLAIMSFYMKNDK